MYLKNKETLRRDYPVVETIRVATVPFNELLYKDNIANFKENVNLKRVENNGMELQTIPDEEKTIKVCNAAKRENPASVIFFPERQRSVKLYTEVFETLDKTAIQNIPEDYPVVAMIEPNITDDKASVVLSAYPKEQYERFLQKGIEQNRHLYLKNKEALRRDSPVVYATRIATVPFIELLNKNNVANFKENVNLKRVENNGMALQTIPDEEKTIKVCNAAKRENPASVIFFPERQRSVKLYTEVFETLDKTAIQNIPEDYPVVAMIKPNITDDKASVVLSAYPKEQYERFLQKGIEQNRLLYLKIKKPSDGTLRWSTPPV